MSHPLLSIPSVRKDYIAWVRNPYNGLLLYSQMRHRRTARAPYVRAVYARSIGPIGSGKYEPGQTCSSKGARGLGARRPASTRQPDGSVVPRRRMVPFPPPPRAAGRASHPRLSALSTRSHGNEWTSRARARGSSVRLRGPIHVRSGEKPVRPLETSVESRPTSAERTGDRAATTRRVSSPSPGAVPVPVDPTRTRRPEPHLPLHLRTLFLRNG